MIEVKNLKKVFQVAGKDIVALDDINLTINKGEIFGIIGSSGAGKSTLVRCFNMLERPTAGTVLVDQDDVTQLTSSQLREKRREIGMIFQHFNLLSARTVRDNIAYPLEIAGMKKADIEKRVDELIELVGLTKQASSYPAQLSGGQKQRVGIARAIAHNPKVLLCDEATSALDPKTTTSILDLLKDINKRLGLTLVVITHEMEVIKYLCDRVAVLDGGVVAELGPVVNVFSQPESDTAKEFVKQISNFELPPELLAQFTDRFQDNYKLLRLSFLGESSGTPIISDLIKKYQVNVNILHGQIDRIQSVPYGTLVVNIDGPSDILDQAMAFLEENGVRIEVLGHGQ